MRSASYYCEPTWHDGETVEANFLLLPVPSERALSINGFATCRHHLDKALMLMLEKLSTVSVRKVNNR
jgi:hypothetical protein